MIYLTSLLPRLSELKSILLFAACFLGAMLLLGFLIRLLFGKDSALNHALSACLGIMMIYAVSIGIYTFQPGNLAQILSPLPLVSFAGDKLILFSFAGNSFPAICTQVLSMVILAFLVNLMGGFFKQQTKIIPWMFYRLLAVTMAMVAHYLCNILLLLVFPNILSSYAPMILLCILVFMMSLGFLKLILGLLLAAVNPVIGALYGFFFAHKTGKQLSQAVVTTGILCFLVFCLERLGYGVISISGAFLLSYCPVLAAVMLMWYLIGCIL